MEKKVLLKDLVDGGTNLRKQIISHVWVSDELEYRIGEIWDANIILKIIVDGASEDYNTLRKIENHCKDLYGLVAQLRKDLNDEISRATKKEEDLQKQIDDTNETISEFRNTYNNAVEEIDARISANETDIESLKQSMSLLNSRISELEEIIENA